MRPMLLAVFVVSCTPIDTSTVACGTDTTLVDNACEGVVTCGVGTVREGNACVVAPPPTTDLATFMAGDQNTMYVGYINYEYEVMHSNLDSAQMKTYLNMAADPVGGPYHGLFVHTAQLTQAMPDDGSFVTLAVRAPPTCTRDTIRRAPINYTDVHVGFVRDFDGTPQAVCASAGTVKMRMVSNFHVETTILAEFSDGSTITNVTLVAPYE